MTERLLESVKEALEHINKRKLKGDVFGIRKRNISYSIKKGEISDCSEYEDYGLGIRVIKDGKLGFGYCTPGKEEKGVKRASELSKISQHLDIELPCDEKLLNINNYDKKIVDSSEEGKGAEFTQQVIDGAKNVSNDIIPTRGSLTIDVESKILGNTEGILLNEDRTAIYTGVLATIPREKASLTASESRFSRKLDMDFEDVGLSASKKVDSLRQKEELPKGKIPVMINQDALAMLLWFGIVPAINGENIRKGKSVYEDKKGEKVASKHIQLKDNPTKDWGPGSSSFDDEGIMSREVSIIENGILSGFIYDLKEAVKSDTESTGNGMRADFKSPPEISDRNIVLRGKGADKDNLMPQKGILVDGVMGAHTLNPASGDFSVVANPTWLIEDGEVKGRVEGAMFSGNLPETLETIDLAKDYKKSSIGIGSRAIKVDLPSARFNDVTVSGK